MQRRGLRVLLILAILLGAVAIFVVLTGLREPPAKKESEILAPLVEVLEMQPMRAAFRIESQGTVMPRTQTTLSSEVSGTIVEISPKWIAGGVFAAGEVLMRIDPTNYSVAVDQAKALVRQRQIEFDGAEKLLSQGYRAEAEHASAAAALASAKAELTRANRNLERTYIRVPYAGMVRSKDSDIGQFVNPGTRLGVVFATDEAEVGRLRMLMDRGRENGLEGLVHVSELSWQHVNHPGEVHPEKRQFRVGYRVDEVADNIVEFGGKLKIFSPEWDNLKFEIDVHHFRQSVCHESAADDQAGRF